MPRKSQEKLAKMRDEASSVPIVGKTRSEVLTDKKIR
jgi:hypothetical protein